VAWQVEREARGVHPVYMVLARALDRALEAKIESARAPMASWDYAEAVDAVLFLMPTEVKSRLAEGFGGPVWAIELLGEAVDECMKERDPYEPEPAVYRRCLRSARREVDALFRLVLDAAHEYGLFVLEKRTRRARERGQAQER